MLQISPTRARCKRKRLNRLEREEAKKKLKEKKEKGKFILGIFLRLIKKKKKSYLKLNVKQELTLES